MATLQDLRPMIDEDKTAVLFLLQEHPENFERKNLKIFVSKGPNGQYERRMISINEAHPLHSSNTVTWNDLLRGSTGVEATSDQWNLLS